MGYEIGKLTRLPLGYVGENGTRTIKIDVTAWLAAFVGAAIIVQVVRPDKYPYFAATTVENGMMSWVIQKEDVSVAGKGWAQIEAVNPETGDSYKSRVVQTEVYRSLEDFTGAQPGDPAKGWVQEVLNARDEAVEAAERAESAAGSGSGGGTSGNITPAMIGAAPANHASEDPKYGMATADLFGHVKAAWIDKMLYVGREEEGQDPDLWYDQDGNLIGDVDAVEQYLRGIVPNMWFMSALHQLFSVSLEDLDNFVSVLDEEVYQLKQRVKALEDEIAALKGV